MKKPRRALLFDPYLDVVGGGEKHILSILKVFEEEGILIDILWNDEKIKKSFTEILNIKFINAKIKKNFLKEGSVVARILETGKYDFLFYVTNGSYFFSLAKKNYIFSMYPKKSLYENNFLNRLKWSNFSFLANSRFTQEYVSNWTERPARFLYPFIEEGNGDIVSQLKKKDKIILSVGRFFSHLHSKKHDKLIEAFQSLKKVNSDFSDFKLVIAGGLLKEDKAYFDQLLSLAKADKNIIFLKNIEFNELNKLYEKAMFYWHATGFGINEQIYPERVEHLGISPLEAMSHGAITCCYRAGEMKRLITSGENGYVYKTLDELVYFTNKIYKDEDQRLRMAEKSTAFIKNNFSYKIFKSKIIEHFNL